VPPPQSRLPRFLAAILAMLVLVVAALTIELVRLDRGLHRARCDTRRATALAILAASGRPSPDQV